MKRRKRLAVIAFFILLLLVVLTMYIPDWPMMLTYLVVVGGICEDSNILSASCKITPAIMGLKISALVAVAVTIYLVRKRRRNRRDERG